MSGTEWWMTLSDQEFQVWLDELKAACETPILPLSQQPFVPKEEG